jgi:polyisoprenoid-binding protein YceI
MNRNRESANAAGVLRLSAIPLQAAAALLWIIERISQACAILLRTAARISLRGVAVTRRSGVAAIPCAAAGVILCIGAPTAQAAGSYTADPSSRLEFTGVQAGAEFKALFHKFTAAIDFAPDAPSSAHFDVTIDMGSVDSKDNDRDGTIRGGDMFDVAHFPTAHYVTKSVAKTATGYSAVGALTLHGVTRDVPIEFKFAQAGTGATLTGTAQLKRLDFGVGKGDWKSTEWVADQVKVAFTLSLKPTN